MSTVTGLTAARMLEIEAACIVAGAVDLAGDLKLTRQDGTFFNAGHVKGAQGIQGIQGIQGNPGGQGIQGIQGIQGVPGDKLKIYNGPASDPATTPGWIAIGSFVLTQQYADANAIFMLASTNNDAPLIGLVRINVKQLSAMGGGSTRVEVNCTDMRNITPADVKVEIREASATQTQGYIWVRHTAPYTTWQWVVLYADTNVTFADTGSIWNVGGEPGGLAGSAKGKALSPLAAYAFRSEAAAAQTLTSSTWTKLTQSVEVYNFGGMWDNASDTVIIQTAGAYYFGGSVSFAGNASGQRYLCVSKNTIRQRGRTNAINLAANTVELNHSTEFNCAVGDVVALEGYQNSGGNLATSHVDPDVGVFFSGHIIGKG